MICLYHNSDLDGKCSAAIIKHRYPQCELFGINYGDEVPWTRIAPKSVAFMVDFSLPMLQMQWGVDHLFKTKLIWIDHHKTAIEAAAELNFNPCGIRRDGIGACALVWEYIYGTELPPAVRLLAEYDVWNHSDPRTLPFQYGFRLENTDPANQELWAPHFRSFMDKALIDNVVEKGKTILQYEANQNAMYCKSYSFETTVGGLKCIAINRGLSNSKVFDSVWNPEKYDAMLTFSYLPTGKWACSMYTDKPGIACSAVAKSFGGGGHRQAAGFSVDRLEEVLDGPR